MRNIIVTISLMSLSACATTALPSTASVLEVGATKADVQISYGKPLAVSQTKGGECLTYKGPTKPMGWDTPKRETVIFVLYKMGKVTSYSPPQAIWLDKIPNCDL